MLDLGTISGTIGLDAAPFDKTLGDTKTGLTKWAADQASQAGKSGDETGKKFGSGFATKVLVLMGSAGVAVAGVFAAALAQGMNLEPANNKVAASLGLTKEQAGVAARAAGQLYSNNWGDSMEDAAARTGVVISSLEGMRTASAEEISKMTGLFSGFADGFEIDMGRATQVVGQMVKTGLVADTEAGLDLLTAALQKVPVNVREDILDAVDEYGPFMKNLGLSGEEAMNMLATSAEKGMYGIDKTGDALKEFTIRATDMSATSKAGYDILGLSQEKMSKALLKGGSDGEAAFKQIVTGLQGIKDPVKQSQAALALFGTPLEDLSVSEIPKFLSGLTDTTNKLGDTEGAAQKMSDTMSDSASANIQTFLRTMQTGAVEVIGGAFLPALNDATKGLSTNLGPALKTAGEGLQGFGRWVQDNSAWLGPLAVAVGVFGAALGALALVGYISSLGGLSAAFVALAGKIGITTAVTVAKTGAELIASGASKALAAAQWLVNAAMTANPIGLVVVALALLVGGLVFAYQNSETFRDVVNGAFNAVAEVGKWLWNNALAPAFRAIVGGFSTVMLGLSQLLGALGKIPGFGWATDAAKKLEDMAKKAHGVAEGIRDIPEQKTVSLNVRTIYSEQGSRNQYETRNLARADGGKVYAYANGGENHQAQFARGGDWRVWAEPETEGEWYLPMAKSKRDKTIPMWLQAGRDLGAIKAFGSGGYAGTKLPSLRSSRGASAVSTSSTVTNHYSFDVRVDADDLLKAADVVSFMESLGLHAMMPQTVGF